MADNLEDPTGLLAGGGSDGPIRQIGVSENDVIGREPTSKTVRLEDEANTVVNGSDFVPDAVELFADSVAKSFTSGDNFAYQLVKRAERDWIAPPPDPNFKSADYVKRNRDKIPQALEMQFHLAGSETEANNILADLIQETQDKEILARRGGFSTFVASGLAGIVDLDTPIAVMSGGLGAGFKGGVMATKWGRVAGSAMAGGLTQGAGQLVAFEAGTTGDWTSIPAAGLGGMVFGAAGGALKRNRTELNANTAVHSALKEFDEYVADGTPLAKDLRAEAHLHDDPYGSIKAQREAEAAAEAAEAAPAAAPRKPTVFDVNDVIPDGVGEGATMRDVQGEAGGSIGARQLNPQGSTATITSPRVTDMITSAKDWARRTSIPDEYNAKASSLSNLGDVGDKVAKAAARLHDAFVASPFASDFDRLFRSGSVVAQRLAYDMFENASGVVRNNRSAAMLKDLFEKQLLGEFMPHYETGMKMWAKDNGISWFDRLTDSEVRERFNREIITELNARAFEAPGTVRQISDAVKLVADAHDNWSKRDIEIGRGRPGESGIKGYENLTPYSGYFTQKWSGANIEKMIRTGGRSVKHIIDAVAEAYVHKHGMDRKDADIYAAAVVRRARASERGTDMNLIGILQQDGREFLAEVLKDNGVSAAKADALIDKLTGEAAARGQAGHTKGRIDLDLRFTASNGIQIMDLVSNDVARIVAQRARGTAGAAALARKGITSRTDRAEIKEAILQEQYARGKSQSSGPGTADRFNDMIDKDRHVTGEDIDNFFSYFDAGPIAGGIGPAYSNAKKLTNLALLNQLGLTQMAELGPQIAAVGLKRWFEHAGGALRGAALNPKSELTDELRHMNVLVPEEKLFRDDFNLEMDRQGPASSEFMQKVSTMLNHGQRLQGYTSGYYAIRNFQQRVAVTSAADKIMQNMIGLKTDLSAARAEDIGLDAALFARVRQYAVNGTVEFKEGSLHKLNFEKWKPEDVEDFSLALNRHVNQVVQKAMAGESNVLFHKDGIASLFFHLKAFPMLALEKQMGRNMRVADGQAVATFFAGLATAAAAYSMKQAINGNDKNLTLDKIARGAFGLSNMTGWLPMWTDPLASMLGMDAMKFNTYSRGIDGNVLSTPAALTTLNRMTNITAIPGHALTGNLSNNDVRALQATPIIGNAYGMTAILNSLKQ